MGIPLSELLDEGNTSMREQAAENHLPHEPFTMRELITPQYRPDDVGLDVGPNHWQNWVGQHRDFPEDGRTEIEPETREELVAAVVLKAEEDGNVRAVGSGHSHSNASAPAGTFIELNPSRPIPAGLNNVLDHHWLKDDAELEETDIFDTTVYNDEEHDEGFPNLDDGPDAEHLKRIEAGMVLRRLNRYILHENGYALENMGSFDGQTIAGAVNTSTHGTGIELSSIADSVASVEIATVPESESGDPIVKLYRIEPDDGITDQEAFEADTGTHEMELIQDDDVFHSVVVGYGCMGVVYAYTLKVVDDYWLREETRLMSWGELRKKLDQPNPTTFLQKDGTRHCQIFFNTATTQLEFDDTGKVREHHNSDEDHGVREDQQHEAYQNPLCMVKRFIPVAAPDEKPDDWENFTKSTGLKDERWPPERRAPPMQDAGQDLLKYHPFDYQPGKSSQLHNNFFHPGLNKDPFVGGKHESVWYVALRRLRDEYTDPDFGTRYYEPEPPNPPTLTTEIGVSVHRTVELIDAFIDKVKDTSLQWADDGEKEVYFYAPMGIRFTAPSDHYLSPEHGRKTAMVELPLPLPQNRGGAGGLKPAVPQLDFDEMREQVVLPALKQVEEHIRSEKSNLVPRPHMGKVNTVDAQWLNTNYDYFDASETDDVETGWIQAYHRFNAFGTFNNKFTDQLNLGDSSQYDQQMSGTMPSDDEGKSDPSDDGQDQEDSDAGDGETVSEIGPGFGILGGVAALGSSAWLANRIGTENETDSETGTEPNAGTDSNQETTEGEVNERSDDSPVEKT